MIYPRTYRNASLGNETDMRGKEYIDMTSKNENATPAVLPIQTKHLAVKFGMKATALRRILRSMPDYADGVHTNYRWAENDPKIKAIEMQIAKLATEKKARAEAAKAALAARVAAATTQAKADAKLPATAK